MTQPTALATKGDAIEEPLDRIFFRPIGFRLARTLSPTRVTADDVTVASLVTGLIAGHLFVYDRWWLGALGVVLFIGSDILDSADGQLARLRGGGTRFGRILDGMSDNFRFVNLYLHLGIRIWLAGFGWPGLLLVAAAGISHSLQATAIDFIRHCYLSAGDPTEGELDLPEDLGAPPTGLWASFAFRSYAGYIGRQARLFPETARLVRTWRHRAGRPPGGVAFREAMEPALAAGPWIAQNIRFALLAVTAVPGWPAAFCWLTILPLNGILVAVMIRQERVARRLLTAAPDAHHAYVT